MSELRPLAGTRVVDVTSSLAGPSATQLLAALGAEVVKVEPLAGDHARAWGPPFVEGEGAMFLASNAGKRSLAVELGDDRGREIVLRLVDRADVFVQSLRPGAAERHGLGADALRARDPRLVYCSIGAFGSRGPLSAQPGYDPLLQAASGIMSVTGENERPPVRVGVSLIDLGTGVWAALGVLAALYERETTGAG
ncbi:MAG TPA: CoA transferase, partial [Gaiellaceae bacterium]|nr:CoA transferase [Gaiellaceae bacterium]